MELTLLNQQFINLSTSPFNVSLMFLNGKLRNWVQKTVQKLVEGLLLPAHHIRYQLHLRVTTGDQTVGNN